MAATPTLADLIRTGVRSITDAMHVSMPAVIQKYDPATQLCEVQPTVRLPISDGDPIKLPVISNVPFLFPTGGGFTIVWTPLPGDEVQLLCSSHAIDDWLVTGNSDQVPTSPRRFSITDAVAIPGIRSIKRPRESAVTAGTDLVIGREDGAVEIRVSASDIKLGGPTATDFVALASLVLAELTAIKTAYDLHTHSGVTTGPGVSGPPVAPMPAPTAPAATITKAI
jgi:hypothetical protein